MSAGLRRGAGLAVAVLATALIGVLSRLPVAGADAGEAALLLTWRLRGEEVGECRRPTPQELEGLPVHMRNPDACVGALPSYRLQVWTDGRARVDDVVEGAGARGDRPLYVYRRLVLEPGAHDIRVTFAREGDAAPGEEGTRLSLEERADLEAGSVLLVTRAVDGGHLELRRPRP